MERNNWLEDEHYLLLCVAVVCKKLNITDDRDRNFLIQLAHHSDSDGHFFNKVKLLYSLKPTEILKDDEKEQPEKFIITMGEYNDGKKTGLPPILEARLRELRSND